MKLLYALTTLFCVLRLHVGICLARILQTLGELSNVRLQSRNLREIRPLHIKLEGEVIAVRTTYLFRSQLLLLPLGCT